MQKAVLPPLKFEGLRPINLQVYDFLREIIVDTTLKPGAAFTENDVSSQLKISRQPVRDALMRLSRDGLITVVPQSGCRVARISVDNLREICFLRATLETAAIKRLPELDASSCAEIFAALEDNIEQQRSCLSEAPDMVMKRFSRLDDGFHELLCACAGFNGLTWQTIQDLKANVDRIRYLSMGDYPTLDELVNDHDRILAHLKSRELSAAAELITVHDRRLQDTFAQIRNAHVDWFMEDENTEPKSDALN